MHRFLLSPPEDKWVDHIDGDGLNNRRSNLRLVSPSQNGHNRKTRGYIKRPNGFQAYITINRKWIHLGLFSTEEEAHQAHMKAKMEYLKMYDRATK